MARRKTRKNDLSNRIMRVVAKEREAEIEYGMKEFLQGTLIGFLLGFLIATQLL